MRSHVIASSQPPPSAKPRTAAISGMPIAPIRSHASKLPSAREALGASGRRARRCRRRPRRPGRPAPVRTTTRVRPSRSSLLERVGQLGQQREAQRVARLGPVDRDQRHAVCALDRGIDADEAGRRHGVGHADSSRLVGQVSMTREVGIRASDRVATAHARGLWLRPFRSSASSRTSSVASPGRDLAQVAAGSAHRVRCQPGVEGRTVIEPHRRDQDEVRLAAERSGHPAHLRRAEARASRRRAAGARPRIAARTRRGPSSPPSGRRYRARSVVMSEPPWSVASRARGARDGLGRSIEVGQRCLEERQVVDQRIMADVGQDEQPAVADLARQRRGLGDRHERVAIAGDDQRRGVDRAQLTRASAAAASAMSATIASQQPPPAARALGRVVPGGQPCRPARVVALDPIRDP